MCNFLQLIIKEIMKIKKHIKASRMGKGKKIGIIFVLVALLPALFYSVYEISSLSSTEELIQSIYSKQLDVILFSINQYALDAAQSWSGEINTLLITSQPSRADSTTRIFLNKRDVIHGMFYADSTGHSFSFVSRQIKEKAEVDKNISVSSLQNQSATIEKLMRYSSAGYRKIEPVIIGDSVSGQGLMLMFVTSSRFPEKKIAGFLIDAKSFLIEVLQSKIEQAAGEEFLLAVFDRRNQHILLSTSPINVTELREVKDLWLFPGYSIGIRLKGTSVEDIVRARSERNLILIGVLDILLIGAVWLVYRTLKKEMELVRLKGDFVSNVSHELRTPLSLIRMFTETLSMKRVQTEEKEQEYYGTILQETERLTHLINNILNFSRMEAGKKQYHFEQIVLNDVVADIMKTYTSHLEQEGFAVVVQLAKNIRSTSADREAVAEAFINILNNAAKYSIVDKYIRVKTEQTESMCCVEVEDHGIGIEKHHHKKIFETFYRVSTGLTNNIKGSGLGLSLVSHIMDAHGGMIELESKPGKGSTFRLLFPIVNRSDSKHKGY
jgi:two-component system, OmpR family, phosphate regulon sensor histidine kinase PhoR